jgi:DNA-binding transcriptional ArsR family regulator
VKELSAPFKISAPVITKHVKVLEHAGLITRSRDAQWQPFRLDPNPLKGATDWLEQYRQC